MSNQQPPTPPIDPTTLRVLADYSHQCAVAEVDGLRATDAEKAGPVLHGVLEAYAASVRALYEAWAKTQPVATLDPAHGGDWREPQTPDLERDPTPSWPSVTFVGTITRVSSAWRAGRPMMLVTEAEGEFVGGDSEGLRLAQICHNKRYRITITEEKDQP